VHRVDAEEQAGRGRGPEAPAGEHPDEGEHEGGVREVEEQVEPVIGGRLVARDPVVERQGEDGERRVVAQDRRGQDVGESGMRDERVLGHVDIIVPVGEAVAEAREVDDEGEQQDADQRETRGRDPAVRVGDARWPGAGWPGSFLPHREGVEYKGAGWAAARAPVEDPALLMCGLRLDGARTGRRSRLRGVRAWPAAA
jgi:hypothetical protein